MKQREIAHAPAKTFAVVSSNTATPDRISRRRMVMKETEVNCVHESAKSQASAIAIEGIEGLVTWPQNVTAPTYRHAG